MCVYTVLFLPAFQAEALAGLYDDFSGYFKEGLVKPAKQCIMSLNHFQEQLARLLPRKYSFLITFEQNVLFYVHFKLSLPFLFIYIVVQWLLIYLSFCLVFTSALCYLVIYSFTVIAFICTIYFICSICFQFFFYLYSIL